MFFLCLVVGIGLQNRLKNFFGSALWMADWEEHKACSRQVSDCVISGKAGGESREPIIDMQLNANVRDI